MTLRERLFLRKLRERDERAFQEMVDRYQDRVFNVIYRMIGDREEAEDLAQEVFITVFKSIDSFRGDSKLSTWLYRIAVNHCKNRIKYLARRKQRDTSSYEEAAQKGQVPEGAAGIGQPPMDRPDKVLEGVELERLLGRAIAELDEDQRAVIVLRDVEELSYEEIGQITGLPEGTVKSRIHRARLALKEKLKKDM